jgi:hypothetical protein
MMWAVSRRCRGKERWRFWQSVRAGTKRSEASSKEPVTVAIRGVIGATGCPDFGRAYKKAYMARRGHVTNLLTPCSENFRWQMVP